MSDSGQNANPSKRKRKSAREIANDIILSGGLIDPSQYDIVICVPAYSKPFKECTPAEQATPLQEAEHIQSLGGNPELSADTAIFIRNWHENIKLYMKGKLMFPVASLSLKLVSGRIPQLEINNEDRALRGKD